MEISQARLTAMARRFVSAGLIAVVALIAGTALPAGAEKKPKAKTATVKQVASVVAQNRVETLAEIDDLKSLCLLECTTIGGVKLFTIALEGKTLGLQLDGIDNRTPANKTYLGTIPKEIRKLTASTIAAANVVMPASDAYTACVRASGSSACSPQLFYALSAVSEFETALQAWEPYL